MAKRKKITRIAPSTEETPATRIQLEELHQIRSEIIHHTHIINRAPAAYITQVWPIVNLLNSPYIYAMLQLRAYLKNNESQHIDSDTNEIIGDAIEIIIMILRAALFITLVNFINLMLDHFFTSSIAKPFTSIIAEKQIQFLPNLNEANKNLQKHKKILESTSKISRRLIIISRSLLALQIPLSIIADINQEKYFICYVITRSGFLMISYMGLYNDIISTYSKYKKKQSNK